MTPPNPLEWRAPIVVGRIGGAECVSDEGAGVLLDCFGLIHHRHPDVADLQAAASVVRELTGVMGGPPADLPAPDPLALDHPHAGPPQNFTLFFPSPTRNFGGVLKARTLKCARLEFSGCRVKHRRRWEVRRGSGEAGNRRGPKPTTTPTPNTQQPTHNNTQQPNTSQNWIGQKWIGQN